MRCQNVFFVSPRIKCITPEKQYPIIKYRFIIHPYFVMSQCPISDIKRRPICFYVKCCIHSVLIAALKTCADPLWLNSAGFSKYMALLPYGCSAARSPTPSPYFAKGDDLCDIKFVSLSARVLPVKEIYCSQKNKLFL